MDNISMLRGGDIRINDKICVHPPTLDDIEKIGEQRYYADIYMFCSTPSDYKALLYDEMHLDWEEVSDYQFFMMIRGNLHKEVVDMLLPNVGLCSMPFAKRSDDNSVCLCSPDGSIVIDETVYLLIVGIVRSIHGIEYKKDRPGNETTKRYMLEKDRKKAKRRTNEKFKSVLSPMISALVNCEQFKYDYSSVWNLTICQFMDAVKRIQKYKGYDHLMTGIYAGTVDSKKLSSKDLNWLGDV